MWQAWPTLQLFLCWLSVVSPQWDNISISPIFYVSKPLVSTWSNGSSSHLSLHLCGQVSYQSTNYFIFVLFCSEFAILTITALPEFYTGTAYALAVTSYSKSSGNTTVFSLTSYSSNSTNFCYCNSAATSLCLFYSNPVVNCLGSGLDH